MAIRPRRIIVDLEADAKRLIERKAAVNLGESGIYNLDAPGMPTPGPDFIEHAQRLGDSSDFKLVDGLTDTGRKKKVTVLDSVGRLLTDLHRRALREPGFSMPIVIRPTLSKNVSFI